MTNKINAEILGLISKELEEIEVICRSLWLNDSKLFSDDLQRKLNYIESNHYPLHQKFLRASISAGRARNKIEDCLRPERSRIPVFRSHN